MHVRIETPTARSAGGVSIRTSRFFHWMNIEDKVDIRLTHRIAVTVNVGRMESQIRLTYLQGRFFIEFSCLLFSIKCEVLHKAEDQKDNRDILGIVISISPL